RQAAQFGDHFRVGLIVLLLVEALVVVERRLQAARLVQSLQPEARGEELVARRVVWKEARHLVEAPTRALVVEVVEGLEAFRAQLVEALLVERRARRLLGGGLRRRCRLRRL